MKNNNKTKPLTVALAGNPNSGKSTLFNELTGMRQKIGNYSGVTVEKMAGICQLHTDTGLLNAKIIDLPGAYSLHPDTTDEIIASDILTDENHPDHPDLTVFIADASNLRRSLILCTQIKDMGMPVILVLNMMDVASKRGITIDPSVLSNRLKLGVVMINARTGEGVEKLKRELSDFHALPHTHLKLKEDPSTAGTIARYGKIDAVLKEAMSETATEQQDFSAGIDNIITHRIWGYVIFLSIVLLVFQAVFSWAQYPMELIDAGFRMFGTYISELLPNGAVSNMIVNGAIAGLSGVMIFIPQIAVLFLFIAIMENTGYMARVSFIMDRLMRRFGLSGRSVIPLISGIACAVPAIMSARHIPNRKERLITIMATPFMTCSARLPVYILVTSLVIPQQRLFGLFNLQGLALMGLYIIGFFTAVLVSFIMKYIIKAKERALYITEIPVYRWPRWKDVFIVIYNRIKVFILNVGRVIVAVSVILWLLASYGPGNSFQRIDEKYKSMSESGRHNPEDLENLKAADKLEASYIGRFGKALEPFVLPIGFNWKIGIGLITSFAAREIFVGTMSTLYAVQSESNVTSLKDKMSMETFATTGEKVYSTATGFSLLIFYAFAMQCISTLAVVLKESGHWKWPLFMFAYMTIIAYISSWIVFTCLS